MTTTATQKYEAFKEQYEQARKVMLEQSKTAFQEIAKDLFEAHSTLDSFAFKAYTKYFNDGDTCYYSVQSDWGLEINEQYVDSDDEDTDEAQENLGELSSAVSEFLGLFDDEIIRDMFGDHIQVTIHRDGRAEIDEYTDHD
jgi:hypothetical protein